MRRCQPTTLSLAASWICFSELRPTEVTVTWLPLPTIAAAWSTTSELSAPVAQVLPAGRAVPAYPAGGDEGADDVVSDVHPGHAGTDSLDHARALVPADERQPPGAVSALQVLIRMAHAGRREGDPDLALPGFVKLEFGDLPRFARFPDHRCLGTHDSVLYLWLPRNKPPPRSAVR